MRLYSEHNSPFSAPVRVAIYAKGLGIEIEPPPGGLLSARFHAINPLGTIPCLMLDSDVPITRVKRGGRLILARVRQALRMSSRDRKCGERARNCGDNGERKYSPHREFQITGLCARRCYARSR